MTHSDIRKKFREFFESKEHGNHKWIESSSLLPTDPSVLFTTAGMQQFKDYYTNPENAPAQNVVSIQKCLRTSDIDEVGDESHLTFFEMLGNFSFGGYNKEKAITLALTFLIDKEGGVGIDKNRISVTYCDDPILRDVESKSILENNSFSKNLIKGGSKEDNFWGPTGNEGPCGPTVEFYVDGLEVWNVVFNEFYYPGTREELLSGKSNKELKPLKTQGIDTGMGLERLAMVVQGKKNIFDTDLFGPILEKLPKELPERTKRIISDHIRAIVFLISDGVRPSNKEQGYVLRRLIRRFVTYKHFNESSSLSLDLEHILKIIIKTYSGIYIEISNNTTNILFEFKTEEEKFYKTLNQGLKELNKLESVDPLKAFKLYESFGLPYEIIKELGKEKTKNLTREGFDEEFKKHQEKSRAGAEKKFGGHGLLMDTGELKAGNEEELKKATRLHTATHLLHASLRKVLGNEVHQAGSDITSERLRFDFTFPRKMTPEEIKQVEEIVNEAVQKDYPVTKEEMSYEDAIKSGAMAFFKLKYPPMVNVYSVGDFSKELCGGPHVSHSAEIGRFKITKEEAVSAGVRRIRATVDED